MLHYKPSNEGGFDYVLNFPFSNPTAGDQLVQFNTFHPSLAPNEVGNLAVNFLTVSNGEPTAQTGFVTMYSQTGAVLNRTLHTIPAAGRVDISVHDAAGVGFNNVGLIRWEPTSSSAGFQVTLNRYAYDGASPFDEVVEAVSLPATLGSRQSQIVPVDTRGMTSVLEISNTSTESSVTTVSVTNSAGQTVLDTIVPLGPNATRHLVLDGDLINSLGLARITASEGGEAIVNALHYGRTANAGIRTMYQIQAREGLGSVMQGTYNTFLNQECFLYLGNTSSSPANAFESLPKLQIPSSGQLSAPVMATPTESRQQ